MAFRVNPQTGQLEDDNGNPVSLGQGVPMDQVAPMGQGPQPGMLAANQRAGQDLSQPVTIDRGGNDMLPSLAPQMPQAPVAPPPSPALPLQPPGMVRDTSTQTRTREVPLPQEAAAMKRVTADDQAAVGIAEQQGAVEKRKAEQEALAAQRRADTRQGFAGQTGTAIDQDTAAVATAKATYDAEQQKLAKMGVKDFWADKSIGQKVAAAIALAMSAVGGALSGKGGNTALDVINKAVDDNYRLQRAQIDVQERKAASAKEAVGMARQTHADRIADLELRQAATWNAVGDAAAAKAAQIGTEAAAVTAERLRQDAATKRDLHLQQWFEGQRSKVTNTNTSVQGTGPAGAAGGKPTEAQARYALLSQQMNGELDTIMKNPQLATAVLGKMQGRGQLSEAADTTASKGIAGAVGVGLLRGAKLLPKSKYENMSEQEQLVANAWDNLTEKYARVLTGAGMPAEEARRMALQNAPHGGDSAPVIAQKLTRMRSASDQMMSLAGPAAASVAPAAPGAGGGAQPGGQDQEAIQWARAHPDDPRAKRILQMHGM